MSCVHEHPQAHLSDRCGRSAFGQFESGKEWKREVGNETASGDVMGQKENLWISTVVIFSELN